MVSVGKADYTIGHKASLATYRKVEVVSWILSYQDEIKLEINVTRNYRMYTKFRRMSNSPKESRGK